MEFNKYKEKGAYHWDLYGKDHIYTDHVDKVCGWVKPGKILDIGAGDGLITYKLGATGIDNNGTAVTLAQERGANVMHGNAYNLGEYSGFDTVVLLDVIEHLKEPELVIGEVRKMQTDLYIVTPPAKNGLHDKYHYKEWEPDELLRFIEGFGYTCQSIEVRKDLVRMYAYFT